MSKLPGDGQNKKSDNDRSLRSDGLYLMSSMVDTTWRMFVPVLSLLLIGNALDEQFHTKPWLMLLGAAVGGCIAAFLIKQQLAKGK